MSSQDLLEGTNDAYKILKGEIIVAHDRVLVQAHDLGA